MSTSAYPTLAEDASGAAAFAVPMRLTHREIRAVAALEGWPTPVTAGDWQIDATEEAIVQEGVRSLVARGLLEPEGHDDGWLLAEGVIATAMVVAVPEVVFTIRTRTGDVAKDTAGRLFVRDRRAILEQTIFPEVAELLPVDRAVMTQRFREIFGLVGDRIESADSDRAVPIEPATGDAEQFPFVVPADWEDPVLHALVRARSTDGGIELRGVTWISAKDRFWLIEDAGAGAIAMGRTPEAIGQLVAELLDG